MAKSVVVIFIARTLVLAALYFASGRLGLLLAVPPGYATVIWPPSGLALGALVIYGWRLWPGILLGSFLLNGYISDAYSAQAGIDSTKALTAFAIAAGSTLQALAGYALVRRLLGLPLNFNRIRDVLALVLITGPVACVVAATCGVAALYAAGIMPAAALAQNWLTWWTGDVFGIMVFLPLVLVAPGIPQRPTWRGNALGNLPVTAMMILIIPLGLTFYAWKISSEARNDNGNIQFESLALESKKALLSRINSYDNALLGGVAYFQGSSRVTRSEWRRYVEMLDLQTNFPGINGLGWIASLAPSGIDSFLRATRADDARNFAIHPEGVEGNYVITYVEPEQTNRQAVGLNIAFEENRKQAADLSRYSGRPAITKRIILVQDDEKTPGFLLLHPMYRDGFEPGSSVEKWAVFDGWVYAPFIAKNFMKELTKSQGNTINLRIYDGNAEDPGALIYDSATIRSDNFTPAFSKREQIDVMQQKWLIVWESTLRFEQSGRSNNPLLILTGGLLITFLLALFLYVANIRRTEVDQDMQGGRALLLPAIAFAVVAMGSASLYRTLNDRELNYLKALITSETSKIDLLVATETESKISALKRMAARMEVDDQSAQFWQIDARNYVEDMTGLRALGWVNAGMQMKQTVQSARNERSIWVDAILEGPTEGLMQDSIERDIPKLSAPIGLVGGQSAFVAYLPLNTRGVAAGLLAGVFSVGEFFGSDITSETLDRYRFRLVYDGKTHFEFGNMVQPVAKGWTLERPIQILDKRWSLLTIPTEEFLKSQRTRLPDTALIAGFLISILTAITAHMTLLSRMKTAHLQKSHERIKQEAIRNSTVMNTVLDGVLTISAEGMIETINPAGLRLFGYAPREVVGKNVNMLMPAPYHSAHDGYLTNYLRTGDRKVIGIGRQVSAMRKDGSIFPMDLSVNEMNLDGKRMFVGTIRDTSEAVTAANALRESNSLQSAVLASTAYMIIATDMNGKIVIFNEAAENALGYTADEVLGQQMPGLWHDPEEVAERAKALSIELGNSVEPGFGTLVKKVEDAGIDENEWTYIRKDGSRFPVLVTVTSLRDNAQQITGYLGVIVDMTKQKEVDRLKSDFVSIVSHELRTPLTSIRGALGLVTGAMSKELPEKANRLIQIAHKNSERLTLLINDILDIDKIASGQMRFEMKPQSLEPLLLQAIEVNQPYAEKLGVVIKAGSIDPALEVNVDAERLGQVMANLLSNAAKFSSRDDKVEVSATLNGDRVRIFVTDFGSGIAEEFRLQIFGKFLQGDSTSTRVKGGSGLGLHISKQIVERMGGTIGFETEVNKGTTFWVEFPLPVQEYVRGPVAPGDVHRSLLHFKHREAPTLLHIEDDEDLSRILAMSLQGRIGVVTATTLKGAERLLRERRFDLVVLDLELPDGSGLGFLDTLSELAVPPIPVMILSASEVSDAVQKSVAAAMVKSRASDAKIISTIETLVAG